MAPWTVAGINFAHHHMGDNLRLVAAHPDVELVGICDENPDEAMLSLDATAEEFDLPPERVFDDHRACLEQTDPDIVILCPIPADHAAWAERIAPSVSAIVLEKPFATSVAEADRIIAAVEAAGTTLAINWPLAWVESHRTTKRLVDDGRVGDVVEVHYYDGNAGLGRAGPVGFRDGKALHTTREDVDRIRRGEARSWWHDPDRGGGSLVDYLGYGVTLGTWFRDGELPRTVTTERFVPDWADVDTQSVTIARYETGLSTFQTKWGAFSDPWIHQPQPTCGFVVVGTDGTIRSDDYAETVRVQDADRPEGYEVPVDPLEPPLQNPVQYTIHCLEQDEPISFGPLSPGLCREAQRIIDAARESAGRGETVVLDRDR